MGRDWGGLLTGLDDEQVLGVNFAVLGKVEVLLCDENALCGDRVSAYPCVQQAANLCKCAIAMARVRYGILTSKEVPGGRLLARFLVRVFVPLKRGDCRGKGGNWVQVKIRVEEYHVAPKVPWRTK